MIICNCHQVELFDCNVSSHSRTQDASTMVELGKQLLHNAKNGDTETVRELMCRGAPFTTDWVQCNIYVVFVYLTCKHKYDVYPYLLAWYKCASPGCTEQSYRDC